VGKGIGEEKRGAKDWEQTNPLIIKSFPG
jgi:hypothetical protein